MCISADDSKRMKAEPELFPTQYSLMKIYLTMLDPAFRSLTLLQFECNGYGPFVETVEEAEVVITDGHNPVEIMNLAHVVIQLRALDCSTGRWKEDSEKYRFIDLNGKGFGAFREAMSFLDSHFGNPVLQRLKEMSEV